MIVNARNGVSSCEIGRSLGITQKSAWFMLHRIRRAMQAGTFVKLGGPGSEVEVDETFIGGKARNMHKSKKIGKGIQASRHHQQNRSDGNAGTRRKISLPESSMSATTKTLQGHVRASVDKGTASLYR